ncbi:hypothetical protein JAN5088_02136 [Jannaschia rubra]|uniref:Uncharacterized protein n=1 Tax=Jannaschia rubra TaxID=282197 RepID=A0A0M6XTR8_9RHOB|nr:hypothetical protein JAN5088_02136 [Jannaschia rubra]SFF99875.1 hypothetical protein SAMN04488517_102184 [Jannaschia rubra]
MMSKRFDLDRNAQPGDRLVLLHGPGEGAAAVLYAGVEGPSGPMACFVVPNAPGFGCFDPEATAGGGLSGAFVTPVAGTRTSGFGPRMHPIPKQLRNRDGVDWAAPTGMPMVAAAAGKVALDDDRAAAGLVSHPAHGTAVGHGGAAGYHGVLPMRGADMLVAETGNGGHRKNPPDRTIAAR